MNKCEGIRKGCIALEREELKPQDSSSDRDNLTINEKFLFVMGMSHNNTYVISHI